MFKKRILKKIIGLMMMVLVVLGSIETIYAVRLNDIDSTGKIAYDFKLDCAIWPWSSIEGYSNASFILTSEQIKAGDYTGRSYIKIQSDSDSSQYITKSASISEGTNYAETGTVTLSGYRSGCTSTHQASITIDGKSFYKTATLKK